MTNKIIHVMQQSPISVAYVAFIEDSKFEEKHNFIYTSYLGGKKIPHPLIRNLGFPFTPRRYINYKLTFSEADIIIIHGLFDPYLVMFLFCNLHLVKKVRWVIWGADFYHFYLNRTASMKNRIFEFFRRIVLNKVPYYVSYLQKDYEFARQAYNNSAKHIECLMYPSNFFNDNSQILKIDSQENPTEHSCINILMGNSADPANRHEEMIKLLSGQDGFLVYIPLSYGSESYCEHVIRLCELHIPGKYKVLRDFMPFEEYERLLGTIDIAMFNFRYQQGMGNIIRLLGLGKTVFMQKTTSTWSLFERMQVEIFDIENFDLNKRACENNVLKIRDYFSKANCIKQHINLFSQ